MSTSAKKILITVLVVVLLFLGYSFVKEQKNLKAEIAYSTFLNEVASQEVQSVKVSGSFLYGYTIEGVKKDKEKFTTNAPYDLSLIHISEPTRPY